MREQRQVADETPIVDSHEPTRPGWMCGTDGEDWPCQTYRDYVLEAFPSTIDRSLHMAPYWQFAVVELPRPEVPGDIHRRFFAWTREPVAAGPVRTRPPGGIF